MSKETKNSINKESILLYIIIALVCAIIGVLIGYGVGHGLKDKNTNLTNGTASENVIYDENGNAIGINDCSGIDTYTFEGEVLTGDKAKSVTTEILGFVNESRHSNKIFDVQVGEDAYDTYVYNKAGECFIQSSEYAITSVMRSDNKAIVLNSTDSKVEIEDDIDVLRLINNAFTLYSQGREGLTLYDIKTDNDSIKEYRLDFIGEQNFYDMYAMDSEKLAKSMTDNIKEQSNGWIPHLIFIVLHNYETNETGYICRMVMYNSEYASWYCTQAFDIGDWKLTNDWYTLTENDYDKATEMLENLANTINGLISSLVTEENIETVSDGITETTEDNTETVSDGIIETTENDTKVNE